MLSKIKNHILCKEFFYKNQWLILALWVSTLIYIQAHFNSRFFVQYGLLNSYIDYEFGFVKRGLFAEILNFIPLKHLITLKVMHYLGYFGFVVTLSYQFKERLKDVDTVLTFLFLILSPLFIKNYVLNVGSNDILFFIFVLFASFGHYKNATIVFLLYPVMVLIHEGLATMFWPGLVFIYWIRFGKMVYFKAVISINILLFFIVSVCVLKYGYLDASLDIIREHIFRAIQADLSYDSGMLTPELFTGHTSYLGLSFMDHMKLSWSDMMLWNPLDDKYKTLLIIFALNLFILQSILKVIYNKTLSIYKNIIIFLFLTSGFICLSVIAFDKTRFISDIFGILLLCSLAKDKNLFFDTLHNVINYFPVCVRLGLVAFCIAIPYTGISVADCYDLF